MIDIFNNKYFINNKRCDIAVIWLMILIIFLLIFLNISFNYKYKEYDSYFGYVKNVDGLKLVLYVEEDEISKINNYDLIAEGLKYNFEVLSISNEYYLIDNLKCYEVILKVDLDKKLLIENNVVNLVFEKEYTTLYYKFKKGIEKWIN